ncbi:uncharacterized protein LOC129585934 [Paramacrobiotus metropolitanus]|uniref:uncharacterized protein LOC129585934 n=1 Tax=Paramacrobiotus metropolitanus TaxID=2943436 RepID=UPI00244569F8|nr:uncharacterized protein LOC129585934 [Paramacrobiotus metropolitanus]
MAQSTDSFRERMKDIFFHKDELENHFQNALNMAASKEDLVKLNVTVSKLERLLNSVKGDIDKRMAGSQQNGTAANAATGAASVQPTEQDKQAKAQPKVVAQVPSAKPSTSMGAVERAKEAQATRVFSNSAAHSDNGWSTFRKNPNIPDTQRIYVQKVSLNSTEESLYKYFSEYGRVLDVKLFIYPDARANSAAVGFDNPLVVQKILTQKLVIDGFETYARPYFSKEGTPRMKTMIQLKQKRYQIFCGGIPVRAAADDIKRALENFCMYGTIRDVRMVYPRGAKDRTVHRGFAFIDVENDEDAKWFISQAQPVYILGKEVDCKPNTRPLPEDDDASLSGSMADLTGLEELKDLKAPDSARKSPVSEPLKSDKASGSANMKTVACIVCKKNPQNCVLLWCGHTETCIDCGEKLKNCPRLGCGEPVQKCTKLE